ncbi:MAG: hypothetical protein ACLGGX_00590 [Bdellovibrionia bacterium]
MRKTLKTVLVFALLFLSSCKKEDPTPHLKDPIYNDISAKEALVGGELASATKALEDARLELENAKPQTGEVKRAQKKVYDAESKLKIIKQEQMYLIVAKAKREADAKLSYKKAFKEGKDWPDPTEFEAYKASEALRVQNRTWDPKKRVQNVLEPEK